MVGRLGAPHHHVVGAADFLGVAVALLHLHHLTLEVIGLIVPDPFDRLAGVVKLMNYEMILLRMFYFLLQIHNKFISPVIKT